MSVRAPWHGPRSLHLQQAPDSAVSVSDSSTRGNTAAAPGAPIRPEIVEDRGGEFRYVTLAVFRDDGKRREEYALPETAAHLETAA